MKYIIEIENEPFGRNDDPFFPHGMDELYRAKGFKSLVFDKNGLDKLIPYIEPDRKAIEDEVWDFSMKTDFAWISEVGDKPLGDYSYQEAKAKYEAWKAESEQIRVGDEVEYECFGATIRFVVCGIDYGVAYGFKYRPDFKELDIGEYGKIDELKKTGRHFPEVVELLKKMRKKDD